MKDKKLTDAELLVLGLVAEMPRHGYQLDQVIDVRGMREWTQIGFSSIYFVLGKLEQAGLVTAKKTAGTNAKAKKIYILTKPGSRALVTQTLSALKNVRPTHSSVLPGMVNWQVLKRDQALKALQTRAKAIETELARLANIQTGQQPLPDFVEALFDHSIGQLRAEAEWVARTLDYMTSKPWLE